MGVAVSTLRRWESEGKCCADFRTHGRHRRYSLTRLQTQ
ncbi:MerR family transcriptional regulator, partial [bacterium]|nr:MerR family transcriptional regulator [bacterium]